MALDPRISLAAQPLDLAGLLNKLSANRASGFDLGQAKQQAPFQNQLLQLQTEQAQAEQPARLIAAEDAASPVSQLNRREQARLQSVVQAAQQLSPLLDSGDVEGARSFLMKRGERLSGLGIPTETNDESIQMLDSNLDLLKQRTGQALKLGIDSGLIKQRLQSVGQSDFNSKVDLVEADPELKTARGKAAAIALGLEAKSSTSAAERIATNPSLASAVAASTAEIAGAKESATEGAKLAKQLKFKPEITRAVKLAEKSATERGEVLTDLKRSEAAMPGLLDAVGQLRELSTVATSTFGGKVFDEAVKQTGFGSTKGATARAKFIAIVNNQVLPLLKPTFGAAFTVQEGESLKATLGDPNSSPDEKMAQLDAFIDQKRRDIETKQAQLNEPKPVAPIDNNQAPTDTNQAGQVDLSTLSISELIALRARGGN